MSVVSNSIVADQTYCSIPPDRNAAEKAISDFILAMGLNRDEENLAHTPKRVALAYIDELFRGVFTEPPEIKTFDTYISSDVFPVVLDDLPIRSMCAHHFMPITGKAKVIAVFTPNEHKRVALPGLSKYARVVEHFSRRPQLQERLTQQIADYLMSKIGAEMIGVQIRATHHCMSHRGVTAHPEGETITIATRRLGERNEPAYGTARHSFWSKYVAPVNVIEANFLNSSLTCT